MKFSDIKIASKILLFIAASLFLLNGCRSASRSPETDAPKPDVDGSYPILLFQDEIRRERTLDVWKRITQDQGINDAPAPVLHPVTSTVVSLPQFSNQSLLLPKVGEGVPMREDEIREALRRFVKDNGALLCGSFQQLSLIERTDEPNGTKLALYQQQIFRYPLRGDFGKLEIIFTASREIVQIKSMCLPSSEIIQRAVSELRPNSEITPESLTSNIKGQTVVVKNQDGSTQDLTVSDEKQIGVQELVIYSHSTVTNPESIALYLAWAVKLSNKAIAYYDAQTGKLLAATEIKS